MCVLKGRGRDRLGLSEDHREGGRRRHRVLVFVQRNRSGGLTVRRTAVVIVVVSVSENEARVQARVHTWFTESIY